MTAIALFGILSYYVGWTHGLEMAARTGAADRGHVGPPQQRDAGMAPDADKGDLTHRDLTLPIAGLKLLDVRNTFDEGRAGGKPHEATDILAPRGTPVLAMADGTIRKLFTSVPGGLTIYEFDLKEIYCYYYAHLDHYAKGLNEGARVSRGDTIGYVGVTGNAPKNTPHLHLAILKLGPEKHWWEGVAINPYPLLRKLVSE